MSPSDVMGRPGGGQPVPSPLLLVHCASRHPTERLLRALLAARTRHARIGVWCVPGSVRGDSWGTITARSLGPPPGRRAGGLGATGCELASMPAHRALRRPPQTRPLGAMAGRGSPLSAARAALPSVGLGSCEGLTEEGDCLADCRIGGLDLAQGVSITKSWMMPWKRTAVTGRRPRAACRRTPRPRRGGRRRGRRRPHLDPVQATTLMERAHELRPCSGAARGPLRAGNLFR